MNKVFVYGTLKEGKGNHKRYLNTSIKLGTFITPPEYTMYRLSGFPGIFEGGETPIHGEVYEVDNRVFEALDGLEGYPDFYKRKQIDTTYGKAWVYYLTERYKSYVTEDQIISDGIWK